MEVFTAGSFKKGTMLSGRGEADLEFFYRKRNINFSLLKNEAIRIIKANYPTAEIYVSKVAVTVVFPFKENNIEVDIIVGFPVNSPKQQSSVVSSDHYTITTGRTHVKYIKKQKASNSLYQSTVRLIKDWKDAFELNLKSFHIELIVASLFDEWDIQPMEYPEILHSFFRHLTSMCDGSTPILPVNWNLFDMHDVTAKYNKENILIVDPADPSVNLADSLFSKDIADIKSAATKAIHLINNNLWAELFDESIIKKWQDQL